MWFVSNKTLAHRPLEYIELTGRTTCDMSINLTVAHCVGLMLVSDAVSPSTQHTSVLQQVELKRNCGTQTSLDRQQKCVCTVSSYSGWRTTGGTTSHGLLGNTHLHTYAFVQTHVHQDLAGTRLCFCHGLTAAAAAQRPGAWVEHTPHAVWTTIFMCAFKKKSQIIWYEFWRQLVREGWNRRLLFNCNEGTAAVKWKWLICAQSLLQSKTTVALDFQYVPGVMFSLEMSMSSPDPSPPLNSIPAPPEQGSYIFFIRWWQID